MAEHAEIIAQLLSLSGLDTIILAGSTLTTTIIALFIYRTLRHGIIAKTADVLADYKNKFFTDYRGLYEAIMSNSRKTESDSTRIDYHGFKGSGSAHLLSDLLTDLEMLSVITNYKTIHVNMVFEVFGSLLVALYRDPQIADFIALRQHESPNNFFPYPGLQKLMRKCYKYYQKPR